MDTMNETEERIRASKCEGFRRLNPHIFVDVSAPTQTASAIMNGIPAQGKTLVEVFAAEDAKRIRQSTKPLMNKLEQSFWDEVLSYRHPKARAQAVKFRLGNGIVYTPDFIDLTAQPPRAFECKGPKAFRGGFENLKVAASLYPEVQWTLVWKVNREWKTQEVLP